MGLFDMFGRKPRTEGKKARKTREFKEESERLRKEALAKKPTTTTTKKSTAETKKAKFLAESERLKKEALAKNKAKKKTITDKPMPKRPSAISLQNAATPKAKRPMKPEVPPTSRVKPPKADGRGTVTGKGGRNVGGGAYERANVTKEQLDASGMSLRSYLNFMDKNGKRPPKAKKMMGGGMAMKTKGYSKGGAMKTKGYKAGGKVRGVGIARKGVRPAKMR